MSKATEDEIRASLEKELDEIASSVATRGLQKPGVAELGTAQEFDCHLYAQDDKYVARRQK
jgi:hypothetical protein